MEGKEGVEGWRGRRGQMAGVNGNANALWSLCAEMNTDKWESVRSIKPAIVTTTHKEKEHDTYEQKEGKIRMIRSL